MLRSIWEQDTNTCMSQFSGDQETNSEVNIFVIIMFMLLSIIVTGRKGNRWSSITIRLCKCYSDLHDVLTALMHFFNINYVCRLGNLFAEPSCIQSYERFTYIRVA